MKDFVKKIEDLSSLGEDKKAERALRKLLAKHPTDIYCLSQLAGALLYQEKFDEALYAIQEAEAVQPTFPLVQYYKGKILLCNHKAQESIKSWDFLLHTPLENFVDKEYGINKKRIKSLKNDALLYKSMCHYCLGHVKEAKEHGEGMRWTKKLLADARELRADCIKHRDGLKL